MQDGVLSLLPPLFAIVLAILTRRVILPLAIGVLLGAALLSQHSDARHIWHTPRIFAQFLYDSVHDPAHLQVLVFTLLLGAMVGILEIGGSMQALISYFSRRIRSRRGAQSMVGAAGLVIFFDDYANTLLVGGTMRSTADRYGISRAKLAYLVDSTAAPVAGLSIVSTWVATEISYMQEGLAAAGVADPSMAFSLFLQSIPYRFYPWLALVLVFSLATSGKDFGPMRREEWKAARSLPLRASESPTRAASAWFGLVAILPVCLCVLTVAVVLYLTGRLAVGPRPAGLGWLPDLGNVIGLGDSYLALVAGGAAGLLTAFVGQSAWGPRGWPAAVVGMLRGSWQMMPAMFVLWFAWALSAMTGSESLDTGGYLASVLSDRLSPTLLPTVVFLLAGAVAFSTGTSWGTMAILTPIVVTLALRLDPAGDPAGSTNLASFGAVLAGAIFGDHCSPISDTTVLSSRSSGCDHTLHVRTQLPYAVTVAVICVLFGTLPAALGVSPWISLLLGGVVVVGLVHLLGRHPKLADPL